MGYAANMGFLDLGALEAAPVRHEPFDHLLLEGFVEAGARAAIAADYPIIDKPGSFALADLSVRGAVAGLIDELRGDAFRRLIEEKFAVSLGERATTFTLRGMCGEKDGFIHTDSKSKIITILIYLNEDWAPDGGRLRLLRNNHDLDDYAAEVPPGFGTLVAFKRSDRSWHGHKPFVGARRVLQMNWVTSEKTAQWQHLRHRISAAVKRLTPARAESGI